MTSTSLIQRFSSRKDNLCRVFLANRLQGARSYKRIAGYFRSSIFELIGEDIEQIPEVKILCNSELDIADIQISQAIRDAKFKEKWNEGTLEGEPLLRHQRYKRLYQLLSSGNVEIKVVSSEKLFLHGKAGIIELEDGTKAAFLGSVNETRRAFDFNYELIWEDRSPEAVEWVEEEFHALWKSGIPLPDVIIEEVRRLAMREEIELKSCDEKNLPAAALAESPIYKAGEQLQPWQRSFIVHFLEHREQYESARLLLADEVGLGKTLSLGASAMIAALLDDGPILILAPSTLTHQWQTELNDKLGIPTAVWLSTKKGWQDPNGHFIQTQGADGIEKCPYHIAIVSTGLITHVTRERELLLKRRFGMIVLDEAHKARQKGGFGQDKGAPNNLLDFMLKAAERTKHILLGTATPIQTEIQELWDLMRILNSGRSFVSGREPYSTWSHAEQAEPLITGRESPKDPKETWDLIRNPLPPSREHRLFDHIRSGLDLKKNDHFCKTPYSELPDYLRDEIRDAIEESTAGITFFEQHNPIIRHTILRQRKELEKKGLLPRISAMIHPDQSLLLHGYPGLRFEETLGLPTNYFFDQAYKAAEEFTKELRKRLPSAGFLKTLLLRRICSSFAAGIATAEKLLIGKELEEEELLPEDLTNLSNLTPLERQWLQRIVQALSPSEASDPKLAAVRYFLMEHRVDKKTWLEHGCIIFSQYYDTAAWIANELAHFLPNEPVAVYAGSGKSRLYLNQKYSGIERECIKKAVKNREMRLVVATDAACEGLNLQTLGTLINIDLPWNPSRLEQRLGRIKRFGQTRTSVDMLNLVYHETLDEKIYQVLSRRMKDRYNIFGTLPDVIQDEWIENIQNLEEECERYWSRRQHIQNAFKLRYQDQLDPDQHRWEKCAKVLSRHDILNKLSQPW